MGRTFHGCRPWAACTAWCRSVVEGRLLHRSFACGRPFYSLRYLLRPRLRPVGVVRVRVFGDVNGAAVGSAVGGPAVLVLLVFVVLVMLIIMVVLVVVLVVLVVVFVCASCSFCMWSCSRNVARRCVFHLRPRFRGVGLAGVDCVGASFDAIGAAVATWSLLP